VTDRRTRDLERRLLAVTEPFGASVAIKHTGSSHLRATLTRGASHVDVYLASTPSDFRAEKNAVADVRRKLRELTGRTKPCSI
jgi:hypothetical protein